MKRKGDWIQTYTGGIFWPLDPRPEEICIEDIAHALSLLCRYNGHCKRFYSIAEHSIYVSYYAEKIEKDIALRALLHDASEAYLNDIPSPIKPYLNNYKRIENNLEKIIYKKFKIKPYLYGKESIKKIDHTIVTNEVEQLMNPCKRRWDLLPSPFQMKIKCWDSVQAKYRFLKRYEELI